MELSFLKQILHLPTSATNMSVYGELGQLPVNLWWKERILKYWNRIISDDAPMLIRAATHLSLQIAKDGRKCYVSSFATLLNNAGYDATFTESYGVDQSMQNSIMSTYRDQFIQKWHSNLEREQSRGGERVGEGGGDGWLGCGRVREVEQVCKLTPLHPAWVPEVSRRREGGRGWWGWVVGVWPGAGDRKTKTRKMSNLIFLIKKKRKQRERLEEQLLQTLLFIASQPPFHS